MKTLGQIVLGFLVAAVLGAVIVHCDAGRGRAQARAVNTITRTVARSVARVTVTPPTIEPPTVTHVTLETSELDWLVTGEALDADALDPAPEGCSDWRARRPNERTWYRVRICGFQTAALRRMP